MKNTVGLGLEASKFSIPDNWLLFGIPNFFVLCILKSVLLYFPRFSVTLVLSTGFFNSNPVFEVCIRCNLKIGKIASLNASSQSRSTSDFFSECFVGLLLHESESKTTSQSTLVFLCGIHQDGICCCRPSRLLCFVGDGVPGTASRLARAVHAASVARVTCIPRVMAAALVFAFFVDPDACVV